MSIVNPATEIEKLVSATSSNTVVEETLTCYATEESSFRDTRALTSPATTAMDAVKRQRVNALQSPPLSINIDKTLNHSDDEPPIIVQLPDLSTAPSLRGRFVVEGNTHKCQGVWAMRDAAHSEPGQTSDFELRLVFPGAAPAEVPVNGRYSGWFMLKNPQKSTSTKIEDKDLDLTFTKKENGTDFDVAGEGVNKFGKFSVQGTLKSNNMIQLYKIYLPKKPVGATPRAGSVGGSPRPRGAASLQRQVATLSSVVSSPRENSSRVRRPSLALAESLAPAEPVPVSVSATKPPAAPRSTSKQVHRAAAEVESISARASRPPPFVTKCKDVLKDMSKQVSALYFADPVDHVKLCIPDYPTIIKEPMDFGTIRLNFDKQVYKTHEMFAEHMRLVFKNAIAYNVRRDNPVHIAARELADLFEEKYRVMVSQLGVNAYTAELDAPSLTRQPSATGSRKSAGGKASRGRVSLGGAPGPRAMEIAPQPAMDGSMQQMMLMHQKMLAMEQELNSLRTAVRQTEIRTSLDQQRVAAQIPLSYDEKKALIENIQRLDGDQITAVVDIIQSAMPSTDCGGEGDEVEIPMDELDTFTLRQLQDYVHSVQQQAISLKRKRQSMSAVTPKSSRGKKAKGSAGTSVATTIAPDMYVEDDSLNDDSMQEEFPVQGRKRSNSLDLFPSDEMELDPVVHNGMDNDSGTNNFDAWTAADGGSSLSNGRGEASHGGSWSEAVSERKDSLHRESEVKAENDRKAEERAKAESDRLIALQASYQEQSAQSVRDEQQREAALLAERERERAKRLEMSRTEEFDGSHDALYQKSFDL